MKRIVILSLIAVSLFAQTWTEFPLSGLGFLESFGVRTRSFHFNGKIYRNACDSGFNDRLSEADTTQRKWIANYQRPSYGIYGDVYYQYPYDTQVIKVKDSIYLFSWYNFQLKVSYKKGDSAWTNREIDIGVDDQSGSSLTAIYDSSLNMVYLVGIARSSGALSSYKKEALKIAVNLSDFSATREVIWSSGVPFATVCASSGTAYLDEPRALLELGGSTYILTMRKQYSYYTACSNEFAKGIKIKRKGSDWQTWDSVYAFDSLKSILDCKVVGSKAYFIVDNGTDRTQAGLYEFNGSRVKKISNWADSLYVTGLYADENELLVSVSEALTGGNPKLHQRSYGKWNKTAFNLPYASNNIIREDNRIWLWRTDDVYNYLPYDSDVKFYYTDDIPKLPDTRFLPFRRKK